MKRAIGIFLTLSSLLTFSIVDMLYDPVKNKITTTDMNSVVTTTTVLYQYPLMYWEICVILIITFILGVYFILTKEKKYQEDHPRIY
ncbi:hypothetical protein QRD90_05080 [Peribacillus frigoritolerans]|uniref:hypothetical protein n=1 Tax=Peribacillus frigoritolerans TaxID=450367 RepID=UPI0020794651|nr:hypothetical protein [Peribacillus frigoritolerans]USK81316.1 hypothetical protein LHV56_05070 [Peribacillus frigoritolerans]WJE48597.1 hypothetical protein QRD90_05080 [Peribacillus frigoritolerans]